MSFVGFEPIVLERLGGLMTFPRPSDVPPGKATTAQNVRFRPGSVETRPGLTGVFTNAAGYRGMFQLITNAGAKLLISLDANGGLKDENGGSGLNQGGVAEADSRLNGAQAFNRLYMAFYKTGLQPSYRLVHYSGFSDAGGNPRLRPLSPGGPGRAPTAADSVNAGTIVLGVHKVSYLFETESGYLTEPSPKASWTAAGSKKAIISNIRPGPGWVIARRLILTVAAGDGFFYITTFRIGDNTTTSVEIDFSDTELLAGNAVDNLFTNFRLSPQMGVSFYNERILTWAGLNNLKFINTSFDGGFASTGEPLGWNVVLLAGGAASSTAILPGASAWAITGDGISVSRGVIDNPGAAALIQHNTAYKVSCRVKLTGAWLSTSPGSLIITLAGTGVQTAGLVVAGSVALAQGALGSFLLFEGTLATKTEIASVPSDLSLRIVGTGTIPLNLGFIVTDIFVWPDEAKLESSVVRVSDPEDPERFDGVDGLIEVAKDDGQKIVAGAKLRGFYYFFKERGAYSSYDDGASPPSLWGVQLVSAEAGAASPNAVDSTEDFIVTAARAGAYIVEGGRAFKISQEIQPTWDSIDWANSWMVHTLVDREQKRIYFIVPILGSPTQCLVLDYSKGMGGPDDPGPREWSIDNYPSALYSALRFEGSDGKQKIYFAGSKIYEHTGTSDDGAAIDCQYDTNFVRTGAGAADAAGFSGAGQDLFGGIALNVEGSGTLTVNLRGLDQTPDAALASVALAAAPGKDVELLANVEAEKAQLHIRTNAVGAFYQLTKAAFWVRPWAPQRPL